MLFFLISTLFLSLQDSASLKVLILVFIRYMLLLVEIIIFPIAGIFRSV